MMTNFVANDDYQNYEDISVSAEELSDIISGSADWTTETIVKQIEKKNIDLSPLFQRRDAWTVERKSLFIESLALGFPIPQIVLAQQKSGKFIVLDGKQRLLSLMQFLKRDGFSSFRLKGLTILADLNNKDFDELKDSALGFYLDKIENATIRTVVIKNWKDDNVLYQIFGRLNTTSVPLSPQELRGALFPGGFIDYINQEAASNKALKTIFKGEMDFRMRDSELLIRYIAYKRFYAFYTGNLKAFLDMTCKKLNDHWDVEQESVEELFRLFDVACQKISLVFGDCAFRKYSPYKNKYEGNINKAVFDIMIYYFSVPALAKAAGEKQREIKKAFEELCVNNQSFLAAISSTTKSLNANNVRFSCWGNCLKDILKIKIEIPKFG